MSRYRGPKLKLIRRLGPLPGLTTKKPKKRNLPGKSGNSFELRKKLTEYGIRLEEKQKLKFNYGLTERQLFQYAKEARRRKGITSLILLQLLEMRLDTICFNLGFATSIPQARQLINHGHIKINNKKIDIPSFQCRLNDKISIKEKKASKELIKNNLETVQNKECPSHLNLDNLTLEATILDYCPRENLQLQLNELLVIEYYSRH